MPGRGHQESRRTSGNEGQGALENEDRRGHPSPVLKGGIKGALTCEHVNHDPIRVKNLNPVQSNRAEKGAELGVRIEDEDGPNLAFGGSGKCGDQWSQTKAGRGAGIVAQDEDMTLQGLRGEVALRGGERRRRDAGADERAG